MTSETVPVAAGVGVFLAFSLACELGHDMAHVELVNDDTQPIHFTVDGDEIRVNDGDRVKTRLDVTTTCPPESYEFGATREVDGVPLDYGTVSCTSNTTDDKTVVFATGILTCGTGWNVGPCEDSGLSGRRGGPDPDRTNP